MRVFSRLSVCSVVLGIIGAAYTVFIGGADDVLHVAENINYSQNIVLSYIIFHLKTVFLIFFNGLCSFGWITVFPILFFRSYYMSFICISIAVANMKEATVLVPPLLLSFILEIGSLIFFTPIAAEFALSIVKIQNISFGKRFLDYFLLFILSTIFSCLSALCNLIFQGYI